VPTAVWMAMSGRPTRNYIQTDEMLLFGYNRDPSLNYQLMFHEQDANWILPQTTFNSDGSVWEVGSPVAGLTNAQNWATYGIAMGGMVAPANSAIIPDFGALEVPIDASRQPSMRSTTTTPETTPPALPADVDPGGSGSGTVTATGGSGTTGTSGSAGSAGSGSSSGASSSGGGSGGHCGLGGLACLAFGLVALWRRSERSSR
jgi:hypothetical protein